MCLSHSALHFLKLVAHNWRTGRNASQLHSALFPTTNGFGFGNKPHGLSNFVAALEPNSKCSYHAPWRLFVRSTCSRRPMMDVPDVRSEQVPEVEVESEQHAPLIDAVDSTRIAHSSLSLQEHKGYVDPHDLRGWPSEPQQLRRSTRSKPLDKAVDAILILFPTLSLGTNTPVVYVFPEIANCPQLTL
jgi:hypothetical protein